MYWYEISVLTRPKQVFQSWSVLSKQFSFLMLITFGLFPCSQPESQAWGVKEGEGLPFYISQATWRCGDAFVPFCSHWEVSVGVQQGTEALVGGEGYVWPQIHLITSNTTANVLILGRWFLKSYLLPFPAIIAFNPSLPSPESLQLSPEHEDYWGCLLPLNSVQSSW